MDTVKRKILAVDDNPSILKAVHSALKGIYEVYAISEPGKVKGFLKETTPDLFLLDCIMHGLTGLDLVNIIREHPDHEKTPIIFLTTKDAEDSITAAFSMGVCDYIIKPINEDFLRDKIAFYLRQTKENGS
jgi:two-component system phosphate regulon response regulator PhoB